MSAHAQIIHKELRDQKMFASYLFSILIIPELLREKTSVCVSMQTSCQSQENTIFNLREELNKMEHLQQEV